MRIAIFSDTFPPDVNGVANYTRLSAEALAKLGHSVQVFTISGLRENRINEVLGDFGFKVNIFPSIKARFYPDARISLPSGLTFPRLIKFKPHIIHAQTPFVLGWEAVMGAKILNIPLVGTHHTFYDHYLKHIKIDFKAARKVTWKYTVGYYNLCNQVTTPSKSLAREMKKHGLKKPLSIIPNFVNIKHFKIANSKEKKLLKKKFGLSEKSIIYMGRLSYEKSIDQVIKSFRLVAREYPNIKLMIVGDGPEKESLKMLAKKLRIDKNVVFTGFLRGKDLIESLQANDIFVTASITETFCIAALEAMAVGLPIIAANDKGLAEIVRGEKNGFLVEPNNTKETAKKITLLLNDDGLRKSYSVNSRKIAEKYSKEKVIGKLENIYRQLVTEYKK